MIILKCRDICPGGEDGGLYSHHVLPLNDEENVKISNHQLFFGPLHACVKIVGG